MIGATTLDELLQADPHNVVRLILPRSAPHDAGFTGTDPNEEAAGRLRSWLEAGILSADPEPSLYIYEQQSGNWVQRGLIAVVGVGDPASSGIVPHEDVMPGPVHDRRDLMAATRANLEPIFLVYEGGGRSVTSSLVDEAAKRASPLVTAVTPDGITHRLWRLADPEQHAAVAADLATRSALIADGHHRYAAYRELQAMLGAAGRGAGPWDYGLAFLVDADAYPPALGAIHRVIPGLDLQRATALAARAFTVREIAADDLEQAMDCLAKAGQEGPAFLVVGASGPQAPPAPRYILLTSPDPALLEAAMPPEASAQWRRLDAAILQRLLMARVWGIEDSERDVLVFHDARDAATGAVETRGVGVVINPVPFWMVKEVALHGERVPRKSTSFGPKPRSGLVLRGFGG